MSLSFILRQHPVSNLIADGKSGIYIIYPPLKKGRKYVITLNGNVIGRQTSFKKAIDFANTWEGE